jgi:HEAT repeat protein
MFELEQLVQGLQSDEVRDRRRAAGLLRVMQEPDAVGPLVLALGDDDAWVREAATTALAEIGSPAVAALRNELQSPDPRFRAEAANVLGRIRDADSLPLFVVLLADNDTWVRDRAATALGKVGAVEAVELLINALNDPEPTVRDSAAWALGEIRDERASAALQDRLDDDNTEVRTRAADALRKLQA